MANLNKDNGSEKRFSLEKESQNNSNISPIPRFDPETGLPLNITKPKKNKKPWGCIAGFLAGILLWAGVSVFFYFWNSDGKDDTIVVSTPNGDVTIEDSVISDFYSAMYQKDADAMSKIVDENPDIIYYNKSGKPILDYIAIQDVNSLTEIILAHGAEFDDPFTHSDYFRKYSLEDYLAFHADRTLKISSNRDINASVNLMLENGAAVEFEYDVYVDNEFKPHQPNAFFDAVEWICHDKELTDSDIELMKMLADYGARTDEKNYYDKTPLQTFEETAGFYDITDTDSEVYQSIVKILSAEH